MRSRPGVRVDWHIILWNLFRLNSDGHGKGALAAFGGEVGLFAGRGSGE
jgi:hypothetical protein